MQQDHPPNETNKQTKNRQKLICTQCKIGEMRPAVQEGEPEYTDHFICRNCQHHDTIPTRDILFNQILTGFIGTIISIYLFITHLSGLFSGIQHGKMRNALQDASLTIVSTIFLFGFFYILFQAYIGFKYRHKYASPRTKRLT